MASVNEKLLDQSILHAIDFSRYNNGVTRRIIALLNRTDDELFSQITAALERLPAESFTVERLDSLLASVHQVNAAAYQQVRMGLETDLRELVDYEAGYQLQLFESTLPVAVKVASIDVDQVYAAALARPFSISKDGAVPMREYLSGLEADRAARIRDAIRLGYIEGESIDSIVRRIRGTRAKGYADGIIDVSRRYAEGMVRTAVNHTANFTRQKFFEANTDLIKGWVFVATLDSRTSVTCASLSGKEFKVGQGPVPPRHISCRSSMAPVVRSWRELGIDMGELPESTRSSMDGQIAESTTFTQWLRSKPASVQDEVLGATRGKLFRENKIEVDRFTDNKGRVYSLDDLRKRDAELFKAAGI